MVSYFPYLMGKKRSKNQKKKRKDGEVDYQMTRLPVLGFSLLVRLTGRLSAYTTRLSLHDTAVASPWLLTSLCLRSVKTKEYISTRIVLFYVVFSRLFWALKSSKNQEAKINRKPPKDYPP